MAPRGMTTKSSLRNSSIILPADMGMATTSRSSSAITDPPRDPQVHLRVGHELIAELPDAGNGRPALLGIEPALASLLDGPLRVSADDVHPVTVHNVLDLRREIGLAPVLGERPK